MSRPNRTFIGIESFYEISSKSFILHDESSTNANKLEEEKGFVACKKRFLERVDETIYEEKK